MLLRVLNIHSLFVSFLCSISYDHSTVLDLLISSETNFRTFLADYLRLADGNWDDLLVACGERDCGYARESVVLRESANSETSTSVGDHSWSKVTAENPTLASPTVLPMATRTAGLVAPPSTSDDKASSSEDHRERNLPSPTPKRFKPAETLVEPRPLRRAVSPAHSPALLVSASSSPESQPGTSGSAGRSETGTAVEHRAPPETQSPCAESPSKTQSPCAESLSEEWTSTYYSGPDLLLDETSAPLSPTRESGLPVTPGRCGGECTLDRVLDCLTKLRFVLGRLQARGLSPFPARQLVALLVGLEERYEQWGLTCQWRS